MLKSQVCKLGTFIIRVNSADAALLAGKRVVVETKTPIRNLLYIHVYLEIGFTGSLIYFKLRTQDYAYKSLSSFNSR